MKNKFQEKRVQYDTTTVELNRAREKTHKKIKALIWLSNKSAKTL